MGRKAGGERDILRRIVALLIALAGLAERAAGAPFSTRCEALWALQQADALARQHIADIVLGPADRPWSPALPCVRYGTAPEDAMALALTLRALALALQTMTALFRRPRVGEAGGSHVDHRRPIGDTQITQAFLATTARIERRDTS